MSPFQFVKLQNEIRQCSLCNENLPLGPRPIFQLSPSAKILIIGQAPGSRVHETGIPFDDPSGDRLRQWMSIDKTIFYNADQIALLPMGFCYPGKGKSGDLPPRPECAPAWHQTVLQHLPHIELTILVGQYAQQYYLKTAKKTLTETVKCWQDFQPETFPLPHPSPRNNIWLKKNSWFERDVVPSLQHHVSRILN